MKTLKVELTIYTDDESTTRLIQDIATAPQKMDALKVAVATAERIRNQDTHLGAVGISFTEQTFTSTELSKSTAGFSGVPVPSREVPSEGDTVRHQVWVVHSPYPDGTWRGIEKCASLVEDAPLLFSSEEGALTYLRDAKASEVWIPVRCLLTTPFVRRPLTVVPEDDWGSKG